LTAGLLGGCATTNAAPAPTATPARIEPTPLPASSPTGVSSADASDSPALTQAASLPPEDWKSWPIIPVAGERVREIYRHGQELGNDPHALSLLGDCQSEPDVFLGVYATDAQKVSALTPELQETVAWFADSLDRESPTAKIGATAGALLWPQWHEGKYSCQSTETPVDCELRIHQPSFAIINVGTHYETRNMAYTRKIIETLLAHGVVPIIATKADNRELDGRLNHEYAQLAAEYGIPLWNFWSATSSLPNHGLYTKSSEKHLGDIYLNDEALEIHRLTALQTLDVVWRAATGE
jgi:hypothetical protein